MEIKKERGEYDLTGKEERAVKRFAIINKEALNDFAKNIIDFNELIQILTMLNPAHLFGIQIKISIYTMNPIRMVMAFIWENV